ncbi:potassium voltage-gated channel Eag-related subfamily H member 8, partial [Clonorchis sinensis]
SNFVLGNAQVRDHPIVYCSDGLIDLTGFSRSQIMSRCCSCSFLWGERTTEEAKQLIMDALHNKRELQIKVYFHKQTGEAFLCLLDIVPIKNDKSQVVLFLVSHKDITSERQVKELASSTAVRSQSVNHRKFSAPELREPEEEEECQDSGASDRLSTDDPSTTYKYERRRSRAVLFHLSGRFDQNAKRKNHLKKFRTIPEYKVQDVQASRFILLHYSIFKIIWDWMILICTFYIAIMVPYNAAFRLGSRAKNLLICDIIVELLFIIDILLNFATTYVSKSGQVVYQIREIAIHYLRGWFFLDLIAAIPFDFIDTVDVRETDGFRNGVGQWIQLLKMARLLRLARLFQKIERYSQYSTIILGLLMCMFFLIAHWFACGWYWIGRLEQESSTLREHSWLMELSRRMHMTSMNVSDPQAQQAFYVSSLYFTTTSLTSVGFGNVSPNTVNEKIFSIITMLIGALMHAAVFGNVTTLIQRMYARRSAYQTKNQDLKDFTRAHHIPKPLKQRMLEFFQAMWAINRGIDKEAIMQSFPENVRGDIALHLNREMLSLSMFKTASPGCRKCLAQMIKTRFATPGEYLVNRGDLLRHIYLVCSGSLEILDVQGTVVGLLGKCDIFGTDIDEFPKMGFSAYDVKSLTYCELQCVALDPPFHQLLEQYPVFQKEFAAALHTELSFNIREGYEAVSPSEVLPAITLKADGAQQQDHKTIESTQSAELFQRPISRKGAERVRHFANMRADSLHSSDNSSNHSLTSKGFRDSTSETYTQRFSTCKGSHDQNPPTCRRTSATSVCVDPFYYNPHLYETLDFIDDTTRPPVLPTTGSSWDNAQSFGENGPITVRKTYSKNFKSTDLITSSCPNLYEICETSILPPSARLQSLNEVSPINLRRNETKRQLYPWSVSRTRCGGPSTKVTKNGFLPDDVTSFTNFLWHIQRELRLLQLEEVFQMTRKCDTFTFIEVGVTNWTYFRWRCQKIVRCLSYLDNHFQILDVSVLVHNP